MTENVDWLVAEFATKRPQYESCANAVQRLLTTLLEKQGIPVHPIGGRVKNPTSLRKKLDRPDKRYESLADVTDLVGVRVITYLPEQVDAVAEVVAQEFRIDKLNSIDKRVATEPDRFGYASLHLICSFNAVRAALPEHAEYGGLKFEIQIRTILQHAWAEIEHDLGYKSPVGIPSAHKRRFSRIAALLEAADEEFMRLKSDLAHYASSLKDQVKMAAPGVPIDRVTLRLYLELNDLPNSIEAGVHWSGQTSLCEIDETQLDAHVKYLKALGVTHIDSLDGAFKRLKTHIEKTVRRCEQVDYGAGYLQRPSRAAGRSGPFYNCCAQRDRLRMRPFRQWKGWGFTSPTPWKTMQSRYEPSSELRKNRHGFRRLVSTIPSMSPCTMSKRALEVSR